MSLPPTLSLNLVSNKDVHTSTWRIYRTHPFGRWEPKPTAKAKGGTGRENPNSMYVCMFAACGVLAGMKTCDSKETAVLSTSWPRRSNVEQCRSKKCLCLFSLPSGRSLVQVFVTPSIIFHRVNSLGRERNTTSNSNASVGGNSDLANERQKALWHPQLHKRKNNKQH